MPRRKKLDPSTPPAPQEEPTTEIQEKPKRTRKAPVSVEPVAAEPGVADKPKRTRSKPAPVPVVAEEALTPKPRQSRAKAVEAKAPAKPTRSRTPKTVEPEEDLDFGGAIVLFRPRAAKPESGPTAGRRRAPAKEATLPEVVAEPQKPKRKPVRSAAEEKALNALLESYKIAPLEWREPAVRAAKPRSAAPQRDEAASAEPSEDSSGRRRRRGRGRGASDTPATEKAAPEPTIAALPEPEPVVPQRPTIRIPSDAPQVVVRDGVPTLVRDGRVFPPISFFGGSRDEHRLRTVLEQMRLAGESGVHIHTHLLELEVDEAQVDTAIATAAYLLKKTLEVDPAAQVMFRVVFGAPPGWAQQYPHARYTTLNGELADPSLADEEFWGVARQCLGELVSGLRELPNPEAILGLHLDRGEWFSVDGVGYDTSRAARDQFREWARTRYRNDVVALRAAWFDGSVDFSRLEVPPYPATDEGDKFVRANRKERPWVDYHLFLSDIAVTRIADLAYTCKLASDGYFLVGVSYGYTFKWSHPASGHLSLGKLLRTQEIDFIAGPPSYRNREPGGAASFPGPIDSFALNGKLYLSEEDYKTTLGSGFDPDDFNPAIKTPQALESVHWRGVGAALAHASGVCWMDLWGNGWLKTASVWDRASAVSKAMIARMAAPQSDPDVAVFIDERSLAYLVDKKGFALLVQNVRESVLRSGMSVAFYLLSDLQHRDQFPESRLHLFLNAWDIRPELRAAIKQRLQRDDKVLFWLYSAGLFDSGRESLERAREVTGIALRPQPFHSRTGTTIVARRHPLSDPFEDKANVGGAPLEPSYFAIPEDGAVLGEYSQTGLPSFVFREFKEGERDARWRSVFLGEPIVTAGLLRALGEMAGAHVWSFTDDVVHVRPPFLTVHCTNAGPRTITLPGRWSAYSLTLGEWVSHDSNSLRFTATDGSTHVFLVGIREEVEQLLNADPDVWLRMDALPEKHVDTIRFDASNFDVPIMRLDEWMEGTEGDELVDDLLFKPRLLDEAMTVEEEPERVGRRRRRGRRDRGGSEETASRRRDGESVFDAEVGMGIMFRKRES